MSYFRKKNKGDNSSFSNQIDQSSLSNAQDCLIVNSNIFNKSNISQSSQKGGYSQANNNPAKNPSAISYLKNFKKNYSKSNQENICYIDQGRQGVMPSKQDIKNEYQAMMNEILAGQVMQQVNRSKTSQSSSIQQNQKLRPHNDNPVGHQNSFTNHRFLNEQDEQSMEQLLNSSINQFERFLEQQHQHPQNMSQNPKNLKKTLTKFKSILKTKLQSGLNKQKQQIKNMLNQYVQLITKLLHDKEQLSNHLEELEQQNIAKGEHIKKLEIKVDEINREKDQHIEKTKQQIQEFLMIIEQFQNQAKQQTEKYEQIEKQLQRLKPFEEQLKELQAKSAVMSHKRYSSQQFQQQEKRIQTQSQKIQTLLQLLQKSQQETNTLKQILSKQNTELSTLRQQLSQQTKSQRSSQGQIYQFTQQQVQEMKAFYQQRLQQLQIQHQEEFIQYEKAIKETITKKDDCIQRLNYIIAEQRQGKRNSTRGKSIDETMNRSSHDQYSPKFTQQNNKKSNNQEQTHSMSQNTFNDEEPIEQEASIVH